MKGKQNSLMLALTVLTRLVLTGLGLSLLSANLVFAQDAPQLQRLSSAELAASVFERPGVEQLTESSEAGDTPAQDLVWHESEDRCLQTGVYETGPNKYTIDEPYPHDELMVFITGGVRLTPTGGDMVEVVAGDTVMLPKGWTGIWDSAGYRKVYVIYDCPDD